MLAGALAGAALAGVPWRVGAQSRIATPRKTEGPFYPDQLPADDDNDLVAVKGQSGIARGEILLLAGTVTDLAGKPLAGARSNLAVRRGGRYHHSRDSSRAARIEISRAGRFVTAADGVSLPHHQAGALSAARRTSFKVSGAAISRARDADVRRGRAGERARRACSIRSIRARRAAVTVRVDKAPDGKALAARFDIVLRG